jgi:hypothetical protein
MFGLPFDTLLLVFGVPLFWIAYLVVFMFVSRDWDKDSAPKDETS